MKIKQTVLSFATAALVACTAVGSVASATAVSTTGTEPWIEMESKSLELDEEAGNNSFETAESISISSLLNKTYPYMQGSFHINDKYADTVDYYSFSITKNTGSKGRVAITLYGIPYGHDYDLYLYDSSQKCIYSSPKSGSSTEVVKTPAVTSSTKYYVVVKAKNVPDYSKSTYRLKVDEYMVTKSVTSSFEPRTLVAESGVWSSDGIADKTSLPSDAIVVSAKVSASAPNTKAAYNHTLRVKIGSGSYIPVTWKSGDIDVPQLVGKKCCGKWYVGFKATMIPGVSALNYISMSGFRLKVEYEYDSMPNV